MLITTIAFTLAAAALAQPTSEMEADTTVTCRVRKCWLVHGCYHVRFSDGRARAVSFDEVKRLCPSNKLEEESEYDDGSCSGDVESVTTVETYY